MIDIPVKCESCPHRVNDYCKGYGAKISLLSVERCTRKKKKNIKEIEIDKNKKIRYNNWIKNKR